MLLRPRIRGAARIAQAPTLKYCAVEFLPLVGGRAHEPFVLPATDSSRSVRETTSRIHPTIPLRLRSVWCLRSASAGFQRPARQFHAGPRQETRSMLRRGDRRCTRELSNSLRPEAEESMPAIAVAPTTDG